MRSLASSKLVLNANVSVGLTSRPLGDLTRTRYLAQARDCSVRCSSPFESPVEAWMSVYDRLPLDGTPLNRRRTMAWKPETTSSLLPLGNLALSWQWARACFHVNLRPLCFVW